jgi:hypothetical protein
VLNLDDDALAGAEASAMHLPDRSGGDWNKLEFGEQLVERLAQLRLDRFADDFGRVGGRGCLQLGQLVGQVAADDVGAGAQKLAELDERGSELGECEADASFASEAGDRVSGPGAEAVLDEVDVGLGEPVGKPVLAEDREDFGPPLDVAIDVRDGADFDHGCVTFSSRPLEPRILGGGSVIAF